MINEWKNKNKRFNKYYFLDNIYNRRNERYLRNYTNTQTFYSAKQKLIDSEFFIWASDFLILRTRDSEYLKINSTFHYPKGFAQLMIIMYYDQVIDKYIPSIYIIMNSKNESTYDLILENVYKLVNIGLKTKKIFKSITTDNELGLINSIIMLVSYETKFS